MIMAQTRPKVHSTHRPLTIILAALLGSWSWQNFGASARSGSWQQQIAFSSDNAVRKPFPDLARDSNETNAKNMHSTLDALLDALEVMQENYFDVGTGTWPDSIDWTAAVLGTHVSATLSTLVSSRDYTACSSCSETIAWDNLINRYFSHTSVFYFGENALSIRHQAYDDMLWVVLGWLENVKLIQLYSSVRSKHNIPKHLQQSWYGSQFKPVVAHRARLFYDLATQGWDTSLCSGGMVWNSHLTPYKNSITNELFISASISMYLYFPGDENNSPFSTTMNSNANQKDTSYRLPHDSQHLENAVKAYKWLKSVRMTNSNGLYADGFHISGWHRNRDGRIDPGTGKCDQLNTMVYTYNQGVVLTGLRGLWLATGSKSYLEDGHELVRNVIAATGWPDREDLGWQGLGRGGVLEEYCDSRGDCSQNGHTFKGIFFTHLAEFCRDLWPLEQEFGSTLNADVHEGHGGGADGAAGLDWQTWEYHLYRCEGYRDWVEHNAQAAALTRDEDGLFGTWWGRPYPYDGTDEGNDEELNISPPLPPGAVDFANRGPAAAAAGIANGPQFPPSSRRVASSSTSKNERKDVNNRGRGRTVETQSGGLAVLRALWQWDGVDGRRAGLRK